MILSGSAFDFDDENEFKVEREEERNPARSQRRTQ